MKTIIPFITAAGLICFLTGCETTGISPREHAGVTYPGYIFSLQPNTNSAVHHALATPLRLAVAQIGEVAPPSAMLKRLEANHSAVAFAMSLPMPGTAGENRLEGGSQAGGDPEDFGLRIQSLRRLAQAAGADYIFIFGGNIDSWREGNSLTFLDATLIGGVMVPGRTLKAESKAAGTLIEVSTGQPVLFASADERGSSHSPALMADEKVNTLRANLRDKLTTALADDLLKRIAAQIPSSGPPIAASRRAENQ